MSQCAICKHQKVSKHVNPCYSCNNNYSNYEQDIVTIQSPTAAPSIGFICVICRNNQDIDTFFKPVFPICDNCIKDLGDIINERRNK